MKIVIAGDGQTATHLAHMLSVENQDIVMIGSDQEKLAELDASGNFITVQGDPTSLESLMHCGVDEADLFVAVTPDESVNILSAQIAKECGSHKCVARVDSLDLAEGIVPGMLRRNGVDLTIYPEREVAKDIVRFINHNWVETWLTLHHGELLVVGVHMTGSGTLCGKRLMDIPDNPRKFHVSAVSRNDRIIIPRGSDILEAGDTVYFSLLPENIDSLIPLCGCRKIEVRRIMITGAGRITENLLSAIKDRYDITVIEASHARCKELKTLYPEVVVVNARSNDVEAMNEEGIDKCDLFLALTGSSEANIVACMVAREHEVKKTVARIEQLQYIPEAKALQIDKIVNKKLINAGRILNVLLDSNMSVSQCFALSKADVTSIRASEHSSVCGVALRDLKLPKGITIGGLIRDNKGMLADGNTVIEPGDLVVVFCLSGMISKVEKLFT